MPTASVQIHELFAEPHLRCAHLWAGAQACSRSQSPSTSHVRKARQVATRALRLCRVQIPEVGNEEKDISILHYGAVDANNRQEQVLSQAEVVPRVVLYSVMTDKLQ